MKTAILAGGYGSRLIEETKTTPKPMVTIGRQPILWHIMMHFSQYGFREFVIATGYKGEYIKRWVQNHQIIDRNTIMETETGGVSLNKENRLDWTDWTVHLVDTGERTQTGGRIKRLAPWLGDQTFMLTWADGVSDINLHLLLEFHRSHGRLATLTAVRPPSRFGHLVLEGDRVVQFKEKPRLTELWVNGAFFVLEPGIFDYIENDTTVWEKEPLENLAKDGELMAYQHTGFWQCMDTIQDKHLLERLWESGKASWKTWKD
jgi:glucose-1-phosphate cytidylyltransferase